MCVFCFHGDKFHFITKVYPPPPCESAVILKKAGVDMSTPQPVKDALTVFERIVGELEGLLG